MSDTQKTPNKNLLNELYNDTYMFLNSHYLYRLKTENNLKYVHGELKYLWSMLTLEHIANISHANKNL